MSEKVGNKRSLKEGESSASGSGIKRFKSAVKLVQIANHIQRNVANPNLREKKSNQEELEETLETMLTRGCDCQGDPEAMRALGHLHTEECEAHVASGTRRRLQAVAALNFVLVTNREFEMKGDVPDWKTTISQTVTYWTVHVGEKIVYTQVLSGFPELKPGHTLMFVHGFDNSVDSAVLGADVVGRGVQEAGVTNLICFSWPSQYWILNYFKDVDSQAQSVPVLAELFYGIQEARANPSTDRLHLVAHSLGNRLSTAALINATQIYKESIRKDLLGCLFFCAADVDINTSSRPIGFQTLLSMISKHAENVTSYACDSDAALYLSSTRAYNNVYRGGRYGPVACSASDDFTTLLWEGATNVKDDGANHNTFKAPTVHEDMQRAIRKDPTREKFWKPVEAGVSDEPKHHTEYYAKHRVYYVHKKK